jgi:hypothetical protein
MCVIYSLRITAEEAAIKLCGKQNDSVLQRPHLPKKEVDEVHKEASIVFCLLSYQVWYMVLS